jgi:hypothetical protein
MKGIPDYVGMDRPNWWLFNLDGDEFVKAITIHMACVFKLCDPTTGIPFGLHEQWPTINMINKFLNCLQ